MPSNHPFYPHSPTPFRSVMLGRDFRGGKYRFGFNTQEKATELGSDIYTAEFWMYNAQLGRRWNVDPRPNFSISPYATFNNNPIIFSDIFGDTIKISGSDNFIKKTEKALEKMKATEEGKRLYDKLQSQETIYTIRKWHKNITKVGTNVDDEMNDQNISDVGFTGSSRNGIDQYAGKGGWLSLAHELAHVEQVLDKRISTEKWTTPDAANAKQPTQIQNAVGNWVAGPDEDWKMDQIPMDEVNACHIENIIRGQAGMPLREYYSLATFEFGKKEDNTRSVILLYHHKLVENNHGTHPMYKNHYYIPFPKMVQNPRSMGGPSD